MKETEYLNLDMLKLMHCNHKCIKCEHRFVYAYEDDSPAGRTPYHWWQATCELNGKEINSDEIPVCPMESAES